MSANGIAGAGKPTPSVAERTRELLGSLSPGERKVARALLAAYPVAGLETVADLAERAKVSAPTVLRFAGRLGYTSYPALQQALMREIHEQMGSPLRRMTDSTPVPDSLGDAASAFVSSIGESFGRLPQSELDLAVELLSDTRLRVTLVGGRFSQVLATYLANHLVLMRGSIAVLPADRLQRDAVLLDLGKRDLMVVFDYRRYDADVVEVARRASAAGARVLLFTDPWLSPAADVANAVIPAQVEAVGPFDSLAPAMSIVETIVAAVNIQLADASRDRITRLERLSQADVPKNG